MILRCSQVSRGAFHSTKISGNSGPKLNGTVLTYRKFFGKEGPPFEVDRFFRLVRSDRKSLFHSKKFRFAVPLCRTFWKFLSETEWNGSVHPGWYNHPENFPIYCSICHVKFSKSQTGIFGRMESAQDLRGHVSRQQYDRQLKNSERRISGSGYEERCETKKGL